jgi:hypothetical protein
MKFRNILVAAMGFLLGSATAVSAGVVMSETAVTSGTIGNGTQHRTIYVQGNKQKVEDGDIQTITDLDKHLIYLVDKARKNYIELPISSLSAALPGNGETQVAGIELKRTGKTEVVADHNCDEYRGRQANAQVQVTVHACVSSRAPGAQEITRFDRKMIAQMRGLNPPSASEQSAGVVLEKESVINLKLPEPEQERFRTASVANKTTVNSIQTRELAAQTFAPPKGYNKLQNQPPENPEVPDNLESAMLSRSAPDGGFASQGI